MDTQLVVRPLLDKVEKNTQESSMRKILFPHVSSFLMLLNEKGFSLVTLNILTLSEQKPLVDCAHRAGLLLFQFTDHLELWRLGESEGQGEDTEKQTLSYIFLRST